MSRPRTNFDADHRPNDTYNSIRDQLERETSALLQERNSINVHKPSASNINLSQNNLNGFTISPRSRWENPTENQINYSNKKSFTAKGGIKKG